MDALFGFLSLILMATFAIGFIGLFIRIPQIGLRSRGAAVWTMIGSFLIFLAVGMSLQAKTTPVAPERPPEKAEAQPKPPPPADEKAALQAESDQLWSQIENTTAPCDAYVDKAGQALSAVGNGAGTMADAYEASQSAKSACSMVRSDMFGLKPPPSARGEVKDAYKSAISACSETALIRVVTMETLGKYLDGDRRPSVEVEIKDGMTDAKNQAMRCVLDYLDATQKAGVTMKAFREAEEKTKATAGKSN
jgi:hypothetical protein